MQRRTSHPGAVAASLALLATAVLAASSGAAREAARAPGPRTLLSVPYGIGEFAQDGSRIAWTSGCTVRVKAISGGAPVTLTTRRGPTCRSETLGTVGLALAGRRALWASVGFSHLSDWGFVATAAPASPERVVCDFALLGGALEEGPAPTYAFAGDGSTLGFAVMGEPMPEGAGCVGPYRVVGRRATRLRTSWSEEGETDADALAVAAGRMLVASTTAPGGSAYVSGWVSPRSRMLVTAWVYGPDQRMDARSYLYLVHAGQARLLAEDAYDGALSPTGDAVALVRVRSEPEERYGIAVIDADGGTERRLTEGFGPQWSPDGSTIAFERGDPRTVWTMRADGTDARLVTTGYSPHWSPDGSHIAVVRFGDEADGTFVVDVATRTARRVGRSLNGEYDWSPDASRSYAWSPDGRTLVGTDGERLYALPVDGGRERALTTDRRDDEPVFSPDGSRIAFTRNLGTAERPRTHIWVMNADGNGERQLTRGTANERAPSWSPDGRRVAFTRGEVFAVDVASRHEERLTHLDPLEATSTAESLDARTGRRLLSFTTRGRVHAAAITPTTAALLVDTFSGPRIELFDPRTGAARGVVAVPSTVAAPLSAAGRYVVFATGRTIRALDVATRRVGVVATATAAPIGLSIEGTRVAWAENLRGRGRVRAIMLEMTRALNLSRVVVPHAAPGPS